ncbi:hypothetical protein BD780_004318 [Clostridium tetanomorphum]|nr:Ig-like domain-containing protein [Clostridium tetanomorphum]NRS87093.1 hypothetical protein [Clostridium tetanomorphum]
MDAETAVEKSNYKLNDHTLPSDAKIELKKDDTQVKITGVGGDIKTGSNTVEISDNVRDAYGNKVAEDTRENFKAEKDDTKPKVASITSIDAETIRVRFTEDVRYTHATNTKNYELKDSSGTDISSDIKEVKAANGTDDDTDVYDIKLKDEKNLSSKKYTLKIKNIADTSDNIMDDYEGQLNGEDDVAPKVDGARRDGKKIVIQFSEEMDSSSVKKAANYRYIDKENKVKELPSKTDIKLASDSKTVTIEFKDSYEAEDQIKGIIVKSDVKDLAGNNMEADYQDRNMNSDLAIKVLDSSIKMSEPSSDVEVEMQFTAAVKKPVKNKFLFYKDGNSSDYVIADTVRPSGDKLIFKFKDGEDNNKFVKEAGADLKIRFDKDAAENEAGQSIQANDVKLYDNLIKPELDIDEKNGYVDNWGFDETNNTVTIKFDTQLDPTMVGAYTDDFNFISDKNSKLEVKSVKIVNGTYLVYTMESSTPVKGSDKITVTAIKDKVTIRTKKDRAGNTQPYEPSSKDTNGRKVNRKNFNVEENTEYAKKLADAKAAVSKAESSRKQADVDAARELVKGLKDSDREDLTKRLDSIKVISNGFTVETKAGAVVGTTIVMVKDVDAAKYDVFVDGQEARLVDGTFVVTINKTLTTAEAEKLVQLKEKSTTPVENFTVETKPGAVVGTTIVMVKGVDASKTVTVDGEATRNVNGTFVVTINKTLTADEAKALVVIK